MEDFLPIPWFPIHPYSRGGEAEAGSGWGGQDSALSHKPGALKMAFISQGRASSWDEEGFKTIQIRHVPSFPPCSCIQFAVQKIFG